MKTERVTCLHCNSDLTEMNTEGYRLQLGYYSELEESLSALQEFDRLRLRWPLHFCNLICLHQWVERKMEVTV